MRITNLIILGLVWLEVASCHPDSSSPQGSSVWVSARYSGHDTSSIYLGQTFSVFDSSYFIKPTTCNLYLSNIKFRKPDGTFWAEPNSYHLIRMGAKPGDALTFSIPNVPDGPYDRLELAFGVDSSHNRSLDKSGDLDPINGMAWDWNTGYRFLVLEGSIRDKNKKATTLTWHIGTTPNYRVALFPLVQTLPISNLQVDIKVPAFFEGFRPLNPFAFSTAMFQKDTTALAADNIIKAIQVVQH